jgi:hypothetical protein
MTRRTSRPSLSSARSHELQAAYTQRGGAVRAWEAAKRSSRRGAAAPYYAEVVSAERRIDAARRTSGKIRPNSRRRTSLRANSDAEIGAQIRETIQNLRNEAHDLQSRADEIADAWRENGLEGLRDLGAISARQYHALARERDQEP